MKTEAKILNLDEFEDRIQKVIKYQGREHQFHPFTVQDYIDTMKTMTLMKEKEERVEKAIQEGKEPNPKDLVGQDEVFEYTVKSIRRAFPTLSEEEVRAMPINTLNAISDFISNEVNDANEEADEAVDSEKK